MQLCEWANFKPWHVYGLSANQTWGAGTLKLDMNLLPADTWIYDASQHEKVCLRFIHVPLPDSRFTGRVIKARAEQDGGGSVKPTGQSQRHRQRWPPARARNGTPWSNRLNKTWENQSEIRSMSRYTDIRRDRVKRMKKKGEKIEEYTGGCSSG